MLKISDESKISVNVNQTSFLFGIGLVKFVGRLQNILGGNYTVRIESKISTMSPLFILKNLKKLNLLSNMIDVPDVMTNERIMTEAKQNIFKTLHLLLWRIANVGSEKSRIRNIENALKQADNSNGNLHMSLSTLEFDNILQNGFAGDQHKLFSYFSNLAIRGNYTLRIGIEIDWDKLSIQEYTDKIQKLSKNLYPNLEIGFDFDPVHMSQSMRKANPLISFSELNSGLLNFFQNNKRNIFSIHVHDAIFSENIHFDKTHLDLINLREFFGKLKSHYDSSIPLVIELSPLTVLKMLVDSRNRRMMEFVGNYILK